MSTSAKPIIVLAHGVWHSPVTYNKLTTALQRSAFEVYIPFLPSCIGARPPIASLPEDTQLVRRLVEMIADQGRAIVMVLHSYGLDIKSRRASGKKGGVTHLVAVAAHLHPTGFSIFDLVREMGNEDLIPQAFDIADDDTFFSANARAVLFDGVPEAEADALMLTLSRANLDTMEAKVQFEAWKHIPVTYVHTTKDRTLPSPYQQRIIEKMAKAGAPADVIELETGHSPYITNTDEMVKIIEDVAKKVT